MISLDQSEASVQVKRYLSTNQKLVTGDVITLDLSEALVSKCFVHHINTYRTIKAIHPVFSVEADVTVKAGFLMTLNTGPQQPAQYHSQHRRSLSG